MAIQPDPSKTALIELKSCVHLHSMTPVFIEPYHIMHHHLNLETDGILVKVLHHNMTENFEDFIRISTSKVQVHTLLRTKLVSTFRVL